MAMYNRFIRHLCSGYAFWVGVRLTLCRLHACVASPSPMWSTAVGNIPGKMRRTERTALTEHVLPAHRGRGLGADGLNMMVVAKQGLRPSPNVCSPFVNVENSWPLSAETWV